MSAVYNESLQNGVYEHALHYRDLPRFSVI